MATSKTNIEGIGYITIHRRRGLKNMSLRVYHDGSIRLSLPWFVPKAVGLNFVKSKQKWLMRQKSNQPKSLTPLERKKLDAKARIYLPNRLGKLAERGDFKYKKVRFSNAKTRWGSCSERGTISLNVQLMRLPEHLIDYVLVHELCHTKEMNHSAKFWKLVSNYCPDYKKYRRELRQQRPYL